MAFGPDQHTEAGKGLPPGQHVAAGGGPPAATRFHIFARSDLSASQRQ